MENTSSGVLQDLGRNLRVFDGFPYLLTRLSPALYHVIVLPGDATVDLLINIGASQADLNQLETCLVLEPGFCIYYGPNGEPRPDGCIPRGGVLVYGKLQPFWKFPVTAEIAERRERLAAFSPRRAGYVLGDLTRGGRPATSAEVGRLAGQQRNGIPVGLVRCLRCGQWKGECLDPHPAPGNHVIAVHCNCDNRNRCAACARLLYTHKLNANYFDETQGKIWFVPGFCGLSHCCEEVRR
ncbi:MAG: hypothetical protein ACE141_19285 [Bryobacteraceae bacterium]